MAKTRTSRLGKKAKKRAQKAAKHLTVVLQHVAFSYAENKPFVKKETFGAADHGRCLSAEEIEKLRSKYE
ncbi:MAG: hypothetical protein E6R03_04165 [Hyphomicrobiaceae bacterium]|nr:MAG: hypothetical protein E6R03_04165 [Hyphomicrobiaceae bacterium]